MLKLLQEPGYKPIDQGPRMTFDPKTAVTQRKRLMLEHRVNFARMYLNHGTPYTLRKFKKIFKHETTHNPDLYGIIIDRKENDEDVSEDDDNEGVREGEVKIENAPVEKKETETIEL